MIKSFEKQIGADRYEVYRVTFASVRACGGFDRGATTSRPQYRVNGKVVTRAEFFALKDAACAKRN